MTTGRIVMAKTDRLFRTGMKSVKPFEFDEHVADVFADMVRRSVPGYRLLLSMIGVLVEQYAKPDTRIYDLGCSLGAMALAVRPYAGKKNCTVFCVDSSPAMIARCKRNVERDRSPAPVQVVCEDIRTVAVNNASFVMLNYTLQFIPTEERRFILEGIYAGMVPGAALVVSEKIIAEGERDKQEMNALHEQFKKQNGYNDLEISQKRSALEHVLVPETVSAHVNRLDGIGFSNSVVWLKCLNFVSILSFKPE